MENSTTLSKNAIKNNESKRYKVIVVSAGGGFTVQTINLIKYAPSNIDVLVVGPSYLIPRFKRELNGHSMSFCSLRFSRRQDRHNSLLKSLPALFLGTMSAFEIVFRERPNAIIGIGQRASVYFLIAARLFRVKGIFVEDITRAAIPSATSLFVSRFHLCDRLYVQWPKLQKLLRNSINKGRLI